MMPPDHSVPQNVQTYFVTVVGPYRPPAQNIAEAISEDYFKKVTVTVTAVGGDTATVEAKQGA